MALNKMLEYYNSKINKEKETITFVNDAEIKRAKRELGNMEVSVSGKIMKFVNTTDFKKAQKTLKLENITQGESKMKITKRELVEMIKTVVKEETEYQKFFKEKLGDKSLGSMSDEEKKAFFDMIDKEWKGEKNETLEPVSQAAGEPEANPTQRLKAKKRDQMLAQERVENYVRKIIREELRFVMFNEKPFGDSSANAKRRILQTGTPPKSA
jgi:hypothetical protein